MGVCLKTTSLRNKGTPGMVPGMVPGMLLKAQNNSALGLLFKRGRDLVVTVNKFSSQENLMAIRFF